MPNDGPLSFLKSWEGFLPPHSVIMSRARTGFEEASNSAPAAPAYRIAFEAPGVEKPALRELLGKIRTALGVEETDVFVSSGELAPDTVAETFIRFSLSPAEKSPGWQGSVLTTYSLAAMAEKTELKKIVWNQLKTR